MCGFVGIVNGKSKDNNNIIKDMLSAIVHRGPNSEGIYNDNKTSLGFRRLSIIDIGENGSQPMLNEDETIILVFNGEIYNYQTIKEDLIKCGHIFKNNTDSEILLHGYEEYGAKILDKIRGMFAFAIWDKTKEELFIARDFLGIKPLYYTNNTKDGSFIFGSEIKSFLKNPNFIKELNKEALKPYLTFQYSAMEETFFKGVYKLPAAHYLIYKNNKLNIKRYWDATFNEVPDTLENYVKQIKEVVEESVLIHQRSDVKVGSFLSGGIDSSYITALLKPNNTFTVGFKDYADKFNETNLAKDLSDILKIKNYNTLVSADDFFDKLPVIQYHMDEPQSNLSSVPLYFLAELASKHVTVVLSGEGADELFGGYEWYEKSNKIKQYEIIPFFIRSSFAKIAKILPKNKVSNFLIRGGTKVEDKFIGQAKIFEEHESNNILKTAYQKSKSIKEITKPIYDRVKDKDELTKMQYLDINLWLQGDILLKADKMSMAHSIELRVPFLDKKVMELAGKIPSELKVNKKGSKYALRVAANEVIPKEWANRKKAGFMVPFKYWIQDEKYYNKIKNTFSESIVNEFFDQKKILNMLENHYTKKENNARKIYTIYSFLIWYKEYFVKL